MDCLHGVRIDPGPHAVRMVPPFLFMEDDGAGLTLQAEPVTTALARLRLAGPRPSVVVLDPPTFSQSKESGVFRAEKDYGKLVAAALAVLRSGGILLASTNAAELLPEKFLEQISVAVRGGGRSILQQHYVPQPPDFPISRTEPAYLKTVWVRVA
mgnify:CR=1 FL=1